MERDVAGTSLEGLTLTPRQQEVLRAVVTSHVGEEGPVGSATLAQVLPSRLSAASIRNTLADLGELGLVEQPHASAGRLPSESGLRFFIDRLMSSPPISDYDRRAIDHGVDGADSDTVMRVVSKLLSEQTRLLGFVARPPAERMVLDHVTLVRITSDRILAVLVSKAGSSYRRILWDEAGLDDRQLERISAMLRERVRDRTLREVRDALAKEARSQRRRADQLLSRALELGCRALSADEDSEDDLVIATRLALLDQPEFRDPDRIRELFEAIETKERLLEVIDQMLQDSGVHVALGGEVDEPALHRCALVASRYGAGSAGAVGVIGPSRMDYGRVTALVDYFARSLTEKLSA